MKILISLKTGVSGSAKIWKGVLIIWLCSLLLVGMVAIPMKGALKSGFGNSMITEKLKEGINVEALADLGTNLKSMISYFSKGLFMVLIIGFLMNTFFSGGLFDSLKGSAGKFSAAEFFKSSAKNFWSFFVISLIISLIIIALVILVFVIPVSIVGQAKVPPEGAIFKTGIISTSLFLLFLVVLLLVADYARAWQVVNLKNKCFRAIGFGFSQTFRTFFSSYPLMIVLLIVQFLFGWLVLSILSVIKPATGAGILMLFILSQLLFFIKILLKAWRYGSVTKMMELNFQVDVRSPR